MGMKAFTRQQAQAMGYLPHEFVSARRAAWNRFWFRVLRLFGVKVQFRYLPKRPEKPTARMLRIRHAYPLPPELIAAASDLTLVLCKQVEMLLADKPLRPGAPAISENVTEESAKAALDRCVLPYDQHLHRLLELSMEHQPKRPE